MTVTQTDKSATTTVKIHPLITHRWSPRMFDDKVITNHHLKQLLEAARWAASSMNEQPWRLIYGHKGTDAYDRIFDCLGDFNQKWAKHAPLLMLTAYKIHFDDGKENFHALHDLGLAMGNLSLQAQSINVAVHQMAGIDWKKAQKDFDVPAEFHVTTGIALGYYGGNVEELPADLAEKELAARKRKTISAIAKEGAFPS